MFYQSGKTESFLYVCTELEYWYKWFNACVIFADFRFQPYLNLINLEKDRVALSRFRVSAHRLEVETGRWHKLVDVPFNESNCRTYLNCLEDEFHFLLECPLYHELREHILNRIIGKDWICPTNIELMKTENKI